MIASSTDRPMCPVCKHRMALATHLAWRTWLRRAHVRVLDLRADRKDLDRRGSDADRRGRLARRRAQASEVKRLRSEAASAIAVRRAAERRGSSIRPPSRTCARPAVAAPGLGLIPAQGHIHIRLARESQFTRVGANIRYP